MRVETKIAYEDEVWECVYLRGELRMGEETRDELLWNVVDMYKKGREKRKLDIDGFEGSLKEIGRRQLVSFSGTHYLIEGDFELGKLEIGVLLLDRFNPELN